MFKGSVFLGRVSLVICLYVGFYSYSQTAVDVYGQLGVSGTELVSSKGDPVQLQGMSLFWSQWEGEFYNAETVKQLKNDWCTNIVRAAMAVESNGYLTNPTAEKNKVKAVVDAAIAEGMYVIIDWHDHHADEHTEEAVAFFTEMAQTYGEYPNVLYEVFNEPLDLSWANTIKPYCETVISAIRQHDPDNIVICGTRNWSQRVDEVIGNEIEDDHVMYTLHYYAGSHGASLRRYAEIAMDAGIPLFVTEFGNVNADGNGGIDEASSLVWLEWLNEHNLSFCNWSLCDKDEGSAVLISGTGPNDDFSQNLTTAGIFMRDYFKSQCPDYGPKPTGVRVRIPAKIETEAFTKMLGIRLETTTDIGGGENVSEIDTGDFIEYEITAPVAGEYEIEYRVASNQSASYEVYEDAELRQTVTVSSTGSLQEWVTIKELITLTKGDHTIQLKALTGGWTINYIEFIKPGIVDCNGKVDGAALVDLCGVCAGGDTGVEPNSLCEQDCNGEWGGTAAIDECNICTGGSTGIEPDLTCSGDCGVGLSSTGAYDDFSYYDFPANEDGTILPVSVNNASFEASFDRDPMNKKMDVSISQAQGQYNPFSYTFGDGNSLDLSQYATVEIALANNSSYDVKIDFSIEDVFGNRAYVSREAVNDDFSNAWQYEFTENLKAGGEGQYEFDFAGAVNADYSSKTFLSNIDFTQIVRVQITVRNQEQTPTYEPLEISNAHFAISHFKIGRCGTATNLVGLGDEDNEERFIVFPNPTHDKVEIKSFNDIDEWKLYSAQGELMKIGHSNQVEMAELDPGIYIIVVGAQTHKIMRQ